MAKCRCGLILACPSCDKLAKASYCKNCKYLIKNASQYKRCPVCDSNL